MEEVVVTAPVQETTPQIGVIQSPFGNVWSETPIEQKVEVTPTPNTEQTTIPQPAVVQDEILDPKDWLKREFEIDDPEILKQQIKEYRELKNKPPTPQEIKFADDQSKQVYELLVDGKIDAVVDIYSLKKKVNKILSAEVNKDTAADFIKLNMGLKYGDLTADEIEYKFNKEYGLPKEPKQLDSETDEDFLTRKSDWQDTVNDVIQNRVIDAKLAKPEIEKAKSQINLPQLTAKPVEPSQESLAAAAEQARIQREGFINKLESDYVKFDGFTTTVKDESVDIPVSFKAPDDAKVAIKERFKAGFDLNEFIDKRWSDENGNQKIDQLISDIYVLENLDKIISGIANNAANQRLVEYRKVASNININKAGTPQQTFNPNQSGQQKVSPYSQGAWSETPPVNHN